MPFNIIINYLFFFSPKCEICYFADNDSLYSCGMNLDNTYMNGLYENNPDKFQFIILGNKGSYTLQMGHITTKSVSSVTLLGIADDLN